MLKKVSVELTFGELSHYKVQLSKRVLKIKLNELYGVRCHCENEWISKR
jgi:hypothetical protein